MNLSWENECPKLSAFEEQRLLLSLETLKDIDPQTIIFHTIILTDELSGPSVQIYYKDGLLKAKHTSNTEWISL